MKRLSAIILSAITALSVCACGGGTKTAETTTAAEETAIVEETTTAETSDEMIPTKNVGDTVETELYRLTVKDAKLTDNILVCYGDNAKQSTFVNAEEFFTATDEAFVDKDGYVIEGIHGFSQNKESENTFLYYTFDFEYIGKNQRTSVEYDFAPRVVYNSEYTFDSDYFSMYRTRNDSSVSTWANFDSDSEANATVKALGLEIGYFNGNIKPLSDDIYEVRAVIQIPKKIKEDSSRELILYLCGVPFVIQ